MKITLILLFLINLFIQITNVFAQGEWVLLESPTNKQLSTLFCMDSLTCWAAGDTGVVVHTTNGGADWEVQSLDITETIQSIFFININLGWAVSSKLTDPYGTYIHKTTDGGTIWLKEFFPQENIFLHTIYFLDSLNGWMGGSPTAFFGTTNGGLTWERPQFDSSLYSTMPVSSFNFYSPQYGFAAGGGHDLVGVIWRTTNYGRSWLAVPMGPEPLQELYFIDSATVIGVGGDFEYGTGIARTTDAGENWTYTEPGFFGVATGVSFRTDYEGWGCLGPQQKFIFSNDSGLTWVQLETIDSSAIFDIVFTDSLHGFAIGDNGDYSVTPDHKGIILKYKADIDSTVSLQETYIVSDYNLLQNFPNPFNPATKIKYKIKAAPNSYKGGALVQLKVYDVLGNEVATLVNEYKPAGTYEVEFNTQGTTKHNQLTSGVYFYNLQVYPAASSEVFFVETKKMILLR